MYARSQLVCDVFAQLRARPENRDGCEWAWVASKEGVVFAAQAPKPERGVARTATTELIEGVFDSFADLSFFILRRPIFLSGASTPLCRGAVRLAAKRLIDCAETSEAASGLNAATFEIRLVTPVRESARQQTDATSLWPETQPPKDDSDFLKLASRLAAQVERGSVLHRYDRPIAALVVSAEGELLSWATNTSAVNKIKHAEFNAVRALGRAIPEGARIYTTLKPCRLCAGAIWQACVDPASVKVAYLEDDPGALARGTVLDLGSSERERFSRDTREREAKTLLFAPLVQLS